MVLSKADDPPLLRASIPVRASDAHRAEALGPAVAALLIVTAAPRARGRVLFCGDSAQVVRLLERLAPVSDLFLYNCRELVTDLLRGWGVRAEWIPRSQNSECDALANLARDTGVVSLDAPSVSPTLRESWSTVLSEFTRRFGVLARRSGWLPPDDIAGGSV